MPWGPQSTANDMAPACTAAFFMAEGQTKAEPLHTQVVRLDNTDPLKPSAIRRLPMASVVLNEPVITVEVTASKARGLRLTVGAMKFAAALFSTPVSGPCRSHISPTAAATWSNSRTLTA